MPVCFELLVWLLLSGKGHSREWQTAAAVPAARAEAAAAHVAASMRFCLLHVLPEWYYIACLRVFCVMNVHARV